jgi:hypothetical protein
MDGVIIGLSLPAVKVAMDLAGIHDQFRCAKKVMNIFNQLIEEANAGQ